MADPKKLLKKAGRWLFKKASEAAAEEIDRRLEGVGFGGGGPTSEDIERVITERIQRRNAPHRRQG